MMAVHLVRCLAVMMALHLVRCLAVMMAVRLARCLLRCLAQMMNTLQNTSWVFLSCWLQRASTDEAAGTEQLAEAKS